MSAQTHTEYEHKHQYRCGTSRIVDVPKGTCREVREACERFLRERALDTKAAGTHVFSDEKGQ